MSNLDILFKHYKTYAARNKTEGLSHYQLVLFEDATGFIERLDYEETASNPFRVVRQIVLLFSNILEGSKKVETAIEDGCLSEECGPDPA